MSCLILISSSLNKFICNFSDHNSLDNRLLTTEAHWSAEFCIAPFKFNLTVWIKVQSSTLGIELDTINTSFFIIISFLFLRCFIESIVQRILLQG